MMPINDRDLLEQYARQGADEPFAALVHRHVDLVYTTALRQVRSPQLAEEIAQSVFTDLSRNARRLRPDTVLTAWLYQVTRRTAVDVVRRESRRQSREQLALELTEMNAQSSVWSQIEPLLDEAMDSLEAGDRAALLLRYFDNKSLRDVGQSLGTTEDAAQKRVSRAVDRLRRFFSDRGVTVGAGGLVAVLSANAVQSAPLGLSTSISALAAASAALPPTATLVETTRILAMGTMQKVLITGGLTLAVGAGIYEARQASRWHAETRALQNQQAPLTEEIRHLKGERDAASARLAALEDESEGLRRNAADLPRLRGEVNRLRQSEHELTQLKAAAAASGGNDPGIETTYKIWAQRATRLRQRLDQAPDQRIPELQYLKEQDWFDAVKGLKQLDGEEDFRHALSNARNSAKGEFGRSLQNALRDYTAANQGQLPMTLSQLKPFFDKPVDDAVLERYKLLQTGKLNDVPEGQYLVADTAPLIDPDNDARFEFTLNGTSSHIGNPTEDIVKDAGIQFAEAHNGQLPTEPSQIVPYLKQPVSPEQIQQVLNKVPPGVTTLQQLRAILR
jgi:RNA polymerase sigma factor (sigma-70 family)